MSAHELAKGFTRLIHPRGPVVVVPDDIDAAHITLIAKRKLNLILKSKAIEDVPLSSGDPVQVFIKRDMEKKGKRSSPRPILTFDKPSGIVTVPGSNGEVVIAAVEDKRHAIYENALAKIMQEAIDEMSYEIDASLDSCTTPDNDEESETNDEILANQDDTSDGMVQS